MAPPRDRPATKIAPSILSSDFARLADEAARMQALGAEWLHVDVMDGHFVPNLTLGPPIVKSLRKHTGLFLDCHCMLDEPRRWVDEFARAGADGFTFHAEVLLARDADMRALCAAVRAAGMRVGVALRPATPWDAVEKYVDEGLVDMVLVMTVEPGFGGQSFIPEMMDKVRALRRRFGETLDIQVDGGLGPTTVDQAADAGANVIVAGSAVFGAEDPGNVINVLRAAVNRAAGDVPAQA